MNYSEYLREGVLTNPPPLPGSPYTRQRAMTRSIDCKQRLEVGGELFLINFKGRVVESGFDIGCKFLTRGLIKRSIVVLKTKRQTWYVTISLLFNYNLFMFIYCFQGRRHVFYNGMANISNRREAPNFFLATPCFQLATPSLGDQQRIWGDQKICILHQLQTRQINIFYLFIMQKC